ncbi:hypothetical protein IWQ60_008639 [Tieghemiomyces parasiticus]|uniref:1-alkyl-2-acetylglycerophosphocholine esterase n=1 Tax=Tieghemiomyces parasiticus TaxID=78921 RepID=A0A9W7ZZA3_9FUNG|nr:hypothetical protein IWQ60_008639 [Tieghemiomyces parasiticus]
MNPDPHLDQREATTADRKEDPADKASWWSTLSPFSYLPALPKYTGPFPVGIHDLEWKKSGLAAELSVFKPELFDAAYVTARIYYPAAPTGREVQPHWLPNPISVYAQDARVRPPLAASLSAPSAATDKASKVDTAADQTASRFPVVYFAHGMASCRSTYALVCGELASRGFVVVVPEFSDKSGSLCYSPHMRVDFLRVPENDSNQAYRYQQLLWRAIELEETIRMVERVAAGAGQDPGMPAGLVEYSDPHHILPEEELERDGGFRLSHLRGRLDTDQTVLAGHSFGAATILQNLASFTHPNIKAAVALDPWIYPIGKSHRIPKLPLLIINSEFFSRWDEHHNELLLPYIQSKKAGEAEDTVPSPPFECDGNSLFITIIGSCHEDQSDAPSLLYNMNGILKRFNNPEIAPRINPHRCIKLNMSALMTHIGPYLSAAVRQNLVEDPSVLSDADEVRPPEVRINQRF